MALASSSDVVAALGRSLTSAETTVVDNLLERASDRVIAYLNRYPDPIPGAVARVVAEMVQSVFDKPTITAANYDATGYATSKEYAQVTVATESATSSGPWLTKTQKLVLDQFRVSVRSVGIVSDR